jgi:hypothetical protein
MSDWIRATFADVILLNTKVKIRQNQHDELVDIQFTHEEWRQFVDAVKAGVYDLPD